MGYYPFPPISWHHVCVLRDPGFAGLSVPWGGHLLAGACTVAYRQRTGRTNHGEVFPYLDSTADTQTMTIEDPIVLLVDDSDNDALLMRTVFESSGYVEPLRLACDGEEAIAYLRGDDGCRNYKQFGMPTVMLLDLNMPRMNGFQVLEWIRQQPVLKRLPVCILSASSRPEDIALAYDMGANAYLVKPGNLAGLRHLASSLLAWLRLSEFAPLTIADDSRVPAAHDQRV